MRFPWCRHCPSVTPDGRCRRERGTPCPWTTWADGVVYNSESRASGGMANGYLAVDMRSGKAIPGWLKAHICRNDQDAQYIRKSFLYECELLDYLRERGYMSAPHVMRRVELDSGPDGKQRVWYLMTEAEGEDWGSMEFRDEETLHKGLYELAKALAELHKRGVGHFDLKPGEILRGKKKQGNIKCNVQTGQVMLIDFGTAIGPEWWQMADAEHHTNPLRKTLVGSKPWVSPEQEKLPIGQLTRHSDVYVYGLLFCKAVLDREVAVDEPRDRLAAELLQQVPQDLAELIAQQALAIDPARRAGALEELLVAMQAAGWGQKLKHSKSQTATKPQKPQCAKCGRELVHGKCPVCDGKKKSGYNWTTWLGAIAVIVCIAVVIVCRQWKGKTGEDVVLDSPSLPPRTSISTNVSPTKISLDFKGQDGWEAKIAVQIGVELGPVIPVAPDVPSKCWGFSHWSAKTNRPEKYDFRRATADMPREFVAVYTNSPIRIVYVVANEIAKSEIWYPAYSDPSPYSPRKKGFKFTGWWDANQERPWSPANYKTNYVPEIQLTALFEEEPSLPKVEPQPEPIQLVFTDQAGWREEREVQAGERLGPWVIPVAPDLSDNGLKFLYWRDEYYQEEYVFDQATADMPREFVAVYTNLPIRIEYVVDGQVIKQVDWYPGDKVQFPENPKKDGFEFKGWRDAQGRSMDLAHYVPHIKLYAQFEQDKPWPKLTVIVKSKGKGLANSATVCFTSPQAVQKYEQTVECKDGQDACVEIKPGVYRKFASKAANLMVTVTDARGERVGNVLSLKENGKDREVTVPVWWTENELKKAKALCDRLQKIYHTFVMAGAVREIDKSSAQGRIRDELTGCGFEGMGYDTFKDELYPKIDNPELSLNELEALEPYWP